MLQIRKNFSSEDAYIVEKVPFAMKHDILFVRSCLPQIKQLAYIFK